MISQGPQFRPSIMVEYASYWMKQYACIQALLQLRPALISLLSSSLTLSMAPLRITADQTRMERNYRCSTLAQQHTAQNQSTPTCSACVFRSKKYRFARQRTWPNPCKHGPVILQCRYTPLLTHATKTHADTNVNTHCPQRDRTTGMSKSQRKSKERISIARRKITFLICSCFWNFFHACLSFTSSLYSCHSVLPCNMAAQKHKAQSPKCL